jgi:hypothetical protein
MNWQIFFDKTVFGNTLSILFDFLRNLAKIWRLFLDRSGKKVDPITLKRFCSVLIFVSRSSQKINKSDKVLILITELNILKRLLDSPNE